MVSGYQADPLAATLNQRSIGLSKLNVTQKQIDDDNHLFDRTYKIRGGVGILHQTPQVNGSAKMAGRQDDTRSARSRGSRAKSINGAVALNEEDQREIIKNALNRKQISHDYHTTLPKFMKSQHLY